MRLQAHSQSLGYNPLSTTPNLCPTPPPFRVGQVLAWNVTKQLGEAPYPATSGQQDLTQATPSRSFLDAYSPEGESELCDLSARWETDPEHKWIYGNHPDMTPEQKQQLRDMLLEEKGAFAYSMTDLVGYCGDLGPAKLYMKNDKSIWSNDRNFSPLEKQKGREKVSEMHQAGIIEKASTLDARYASAVTMPAKRAPDGTWCDKRFCCDLRAINNNSVVDRYKGATWRSKIDCRSGFFNIPLSEESKQYCAF
ncbi:hypothetical protein COO60DRAFT_1579417, partial [Scenedesmus sp. NREL 46B-D3]